MSSRDQLLNLKLKQHFLVVVAAALTVMMQIVPAAFAETALRLDPGWMKLLHYRKNQLGTYESDVLGSKFYFAADGRTNPEQEMRAEIAVFSGPDSTQMADLDLKCIFPARFQLLNELNGGSWPKPTNCPELNSWLSEISAKSATVVYAAQYVASPASLFGHIFIRFDVEPAASPWKVDSLAHSAGYFAQIPPGTNAFSYVIQGLGGGFEGKWIFSTYAKELNEYGKMEDRDVWEFPMRLSAPELKLLTLHIWELKGSSEFGYYFLLHNCAYQLLALIEAAAPRWGLTDVAHGFLVPGDAVKILDRFGVIETTHYRPALGTHLRQEVRALSHKQVETLSKISSGDAAAIVTAQSDAAVLDAAVDAVDYRIYKAKGQVSDRDVTLQSALLRLRSQVPLGVPKDEPVPLIESPIVGHGPSRFGLGLDQTSGVGGVAFLLRPGLHRVTEGAGYPPGLTLNGFDLRAVYQPSVPNLFIDRFTLIEIENFREFEPVDHGFAWRVISAFYRPLQTDPGTLPMAFALSPAIGLAKTQAQRMFREYVLIEAPIEFQNAQIGGNNIALGGAAGLIVASLGWPSFRLEYSADRFWSGMNLWRTSLLAELSQPVNRNTAIELSFLQQFSAIKSEIAVALFF